MIFELLDYSYYYISNVYIHAQNSDQNEVGTEVESYWKFEYLIFAPLEFDLFDFGYSPSGFLKKRPWESGAVSQSLGNLPRLWPSLLSHLGLGHVAAGGRCVVHPSRFEAMQCRNSVGCRVHGDVLVSKAQREEKPHLLGAETKSHSFDAFC